VAVEAELRGQGEVRRAVVPASLREDLNDASRSLGSVERGRRRPLENLDALDLVGVQVRESVLTGAAGESAAGRASAGGASPFHLTGVDPNAVDVDHGALAQREGVGSANAKFAAGADASHRPDGTHSGNAAFQRRAETGLGRDVVDAGDVEGSRSRSQLASFHLSGGTRDHDLVESDGGLAKAEVLDGRLT